MIYAKEFQLDYIKLSALVSSGNNNDDRIYLALHGWLDNAATFEKQMLYFSDLTWCALDLSGHGLSEHRSAGSFYHMWDYVLEVVSLIDQLEKQVCLIGHSMGAAVAMLVAAIAPEKIDALVMLDNVGPITIKASERVTRLQQSIHSMKKILQKEKKIKTYPDMEKMINARATGFMPLSYTAAEKLVLRGSYKNDTGGYSWTHDPKLVLATPYPMSQEGVAAFAAEVHCPTLLLLAKDGIYADRHDQVMRKVGEFPNISVKWLDGNHHFHLEENTSLEVCNEINTFLIKKNLR